VGEKYSIEWSILRFPKLWTRIHSKEAGSFQTVKFGRVAWRIVSESFDTLSVEGFEGVVSAGLPNFGSYEVNLCHQYHGGYMAGDSRVCGKYL